MGCESVRDAAAAGRAAADRRGALPEGAPGLRRPVVRDGGPTEWHFDPWGLVDKDGPWYVVAGTDRGQRTFRLDRIVEAEATELPASRPAESNWPTLGSESRRGGAPAPGRRRPCWSLPGWSPRCRPVSGAVPMSSARSPTGDSGPG
ncbi:MAG: WYL domain-containing protein [Actinobacteria bacterium]|nr:WYL domain-containing protein [Actinomycetota bacterium]